MGDGLNHSAAYIQEKLRPFSMALEYYPAAYQGNPLNLLFLDQDAEPIRDGFSYLREVDGPSLQADGREYLFGEDAIWPFPAYPVHERPDPVELSQRLAIRYPLAQRLLLKQREIGKRLIESVNRIQPDVVLLMVVDGLSYYDLASYIETEPCLVDGCSITSIGYRDVIGNPPVSQYLFRAGYKRQLGFTFYDVETNDLSADLFTLFGGEQVRRIREFDEAIKAVRFAKLAHGYIQVTTPGLDHCSHNHHDNPLRESYLQRIWERFDGIITAAEKHAHSVLSCLTADHGIAWREFLEPYAEVITTYQSSDTDHQRYLSGMRRQMPGQYFQNGQHTYTCLSWPYVTRKFKATEWGVHGGISAWESLVPFILRYE